MPEAPNSKTLICREFIRAPNNRAQLRRDCLLHNAAKSGSFAGFETCGMHFFPAQL